MTRESPWASDQAAGGLDGGAIRGVNPEWAGNRSDGARPFVWPTLRPQRRVMASTRPSGRRASSETRVVRTNLLRGFLYSCLSYSNATSQQRRAKE
jgi:hypothetical protein